MIRAALEAIRGDIAKARQEYARGKAVMDELGRPVMSAFAVQEGWYIEMLARDFRRAEDLTRSEYGTLVEAKLTRPPRHHVVPVTAGRSDVRCRGPCVAG